MQTEQQRVWVDKVLGVNSAANHDEGSASADFGLLVEAYGAASPEVDDQINDFQNELLDYDDEDLNRIASDELNIIFASERLVLEAALARGPSETVVDAD